MREWDLLRHVYQANPSLGDRVTIPPGDDMGAITVGGQTVLVTVDQVADGVHVDLATTPIEKVGRKAITRNLSDVAAMAALPVGAVAAASLPRDFGDSRTRQLFDAMRATAEAFRCPVFGGDVLIWDGPLLLTVTILAEMAEPGAGALGDAGEQAEMLPVRRSGALVGDGIYVTGRLGGSIETIDGYTHHLDFQPRITLARQLAKSPATRPHCMIDLSDGLASDLRHLCDASGVSAVVFADLLPFSRGAEVAAARTGREPWHHAVADGEDYELLFTGAIDPDLIADGIDGVPVTLIGRITEKNDRPRVELQWDNGQAPVDLADLGWEHHA